MKILVLIIDFKKIKNQLKLEYYQMKILILEDQMSILDEI
jgi:hypothetical protein